MIYILTVFSFKLPAALFSKTGSPYFGEHYALCTMRYALCTMHFDFSNACQSEIYGIKAQMLLAPLCLSLEIS